MVCLVDDQEISERQLHHVAADGAVVQGADRGDLHPLQRPGIEPGLDDARAHVIRGELLVGLGNDLPSMRQNQDVPPFGAPG
jgi:hypothetical protein